MCELIELTLIIAGIIAGTLTLLAMAFDVARSLAREMRVKTRGKQPKSELEVEAVVHYPITKRMVLKRGMPETVTAAPWAYPDFAKWTVYLVPKE